MPLPIDLPFGTAIELLDPLERSPYLTGASPVTEHERVLASLRAGLASDDGARARVVGEARRLGLRGEADAVLREVARMVADGRWGLGGGRDVGPPVLPDPGPGFDDFEPGDVDAWSVFSPDWSVPEAVVGQLVQARARAVGVPDGVVAHVEVFAQVRPDAPALPAGGGSAAIRGGVIVVAWEVAYPGDRRSIVPAWELPEGEQYAPPQFHFVVRVRGREFGSGGGSGYLRMLDVLELHMRDLDPSALVDRRGQVRLADGSVQQVRVAADGRVSLHGVAPGPFELELDSYPEEF